MGDNICTEIEVYMQTTELQYLYFYGGLGFADAQNQKGIFYTLALFSPPVTPPFMCRFRSVRHSGM